MKYFCSLLLLLFPFFTEAQVNGVVTDNNKKPLPSVSVLLKNSYLGTSTNTNGEFSMPKLPTGTQTLIFKSLGYKTLQQTIEVTASAIHLEVALEQDERVLEEVVISNTENPALRIIKQAYVIEKRTAIRWINTKQTFTPKG